MSAIASELQKINPSAIIELYKLELTVALHGTAQTYRFHDGTNALGNTSIIWGGQAFTPFPCNVEGFEYSGSGQLPQPRMKVANASGVITSILIAVNTFNPGNDLIGAKLSRIRTCARFLDAQNFPGNVNPYGTPDPTAQWPVEIFYVIQKSAETRDLVEWTLGSAFDLQGVRAPKRQCLSNICAWTYRSGECGYTSTRYYDEQNARISDASLDTCSKTLTACKKRFGALKTNGVVTAGSNILTGVDSSITPETSVGDVVAGFGLPSGTTVTAVGTTTLTLSNNAIGTNADNTYSPGLQVTVPGTVVNNGVALQVSNLGALPGTPAAIRVGMSVSGPFLPLDQQVVVTNITANSSGYLLGLSITTNSQFVGTFRGSRTVSVFPNRTLLYTGNTPITGLAVGDTITGEQVFPETTVSAKNTSGSIITASKDLRVSSGSIVISIYSPPSATSSLYNFTASRDYWVRPSLIGLPYGGFPGVSNFAV